MFVCLVPIFVLTSIRQLRPEAVLLKILDGMVEKITEELPRTTINPVNAYIQEKKVITYKCCSFLVQELSRLYNKDFKYNADIHYNSNIQTTNNTNNNNNNTTNGNTENGNGAGDTANMNGTTTPNGNNTSSHADGKFGNVTVLKESEYEVIYFMLRILGHVTSCVEECDSTRLSVGEDDLRTKLGKEGLLAIVIGMCMRSHKGEGKGEGVGMVFTILQQRSGFPPPHSPAKI